jgi:hypothetical protein
MVDREASGQSWVRWTRGSSRGLLRSANDSSRCLDVNSQSDAGPPVDRGLGLGALVDAHRWDLDTLRRDTPQASYVDEHRPAGALAVRQRGLGQLSDAQGLPDAGKRAGDR